MSLQKTRMGAEELLKRYCASVYGRTGSFLEASRLLGIDRRTVRSKVASFRQRRDRDPA